jgi:hypothetical protein
MNRTLRVALAAALAAALANASCESDDPARVDRPPVVETFEPTDRRVDAFVGDTLRFTIHATDPDRDALATSFYLDERWVAGSDVWDFAIEDTGLVSIRARVTDGTHTSYIDWRVQSTIPLNLPPLIETTLPVEPQPVLVIGNTMSFAVIANDPENARLSYSFFVNDSLIVNDRQFSYLASSVGMKVVRCVVSDGENQVSQEWQLKVTTIPDNIPPATVAITRLETGAEPGEVNLEWTAVGRDGMTGKPSFYEVRTSPVPFLSEADWARGSNRPGVPPPAEPGQTMHMVVGGLLPARLTYVAVRAADDFGNISPIQPPIQVMTRGMRFGGRVVDTVTWQGIPDARVTFGDGLVVTDANGVFEFVEQGYGDGIIAARDEDGPEVGAYFNYDMAYSVKHLDVVNLYLMPAYPLTTTYYTDFLTFFRAMTDIGGVPAAADQHRRDLPIDLYVRPFVKNGLDYQATILSVAAELDTIFHSEVFVPVSDASSPIRVETDYNGIISRDRYQVLTWSADWYPMAGLIEFRVHYTPGVVDAFRQIIRHEMGHALGLNHSLDPKHLMVGGQAASVPTFTSDEIAVLRTYYAIPTGWNVRRYRRD